MKPILSIIIVSWNVRELLKENLAQLFELSDELDFEVIVIDNASSDDTRSMVREEFPSVELISNDWNAGFAYACNQGMRIARGDVILLLNPDTKVNKGTLIETYGVLMSDSEVGVMGVKLLSEKDELVRSVRRDPSFIDQLALLLKLPHFVKLDVIDNYLAMDMDYEKSQSVEHIRGAYFAFRRDVMDVVGMFDERFFLWFEEVDYCKRVRDAGYNVHYCAEVSCTDLVGSSFAQVSLTKKQMILSRSIILYFAKWHPWWQSVVFRIARPFLIMSAFVYDTVKRFL